MERFVQTLTYRFNGNRMENVTKMNTCLTQRLHISLWSEIVMLCLGVQYKINKSESCIKYCSRICVLAPASPDGCDQAEAWCDLPTTIGCYATYMSACDCDLPRGVWLASTIRAGKSTFGLKFSCRLSTFLMRWAVPVRLLGDESRTLRGQCIHTRCRNVFSFV